ncbi:MAG: cyclic nucleotide-binding domain-containing protein [Desulfobulbaceae bacterium]|nr:cyclic nucleotide-binding domain-containing protein [Desulfobulbaceae bacterium]
MIEEKTAGSLFERLISGTQKISNSEEFRSAIKSSPRDPWLYRLMADFHKRNKSFIEADKTYRKAYNLFMEQGESLQGIAALLRSWSIIRPTPHDFRTLHSQLRRKGSHSSAIAECLAKMSYRELTAVLNKSVLVKYPAQHVVRKAGEIDDSLFLVVYGKLVSTAPDDNGPQDGNNARILKENDFFGDRHPSPDEKSISNLVKTTTEVELLKISKPDLLTLCGEHPDLQIGLKGLQKDLSLNDEEKPTKFFRKTSRRKLITTMLLEIFDREPGKFPFVVKCFTSDMSLGGVCVVVDPRYRDLPIADLVNRKSRLNISLPDESISLTILGRLAWYKETDLDGEDTYAIGIQFNEMPPRLRGLMIVFANAMGSMSHQIEAGREKNLRKGSASANQR